MLSPQREADLRLIKAALKRSNYREGGEKHHKPQVYTKEKHVNQIA